MLEELLKLQDEQTAKLNPLVEIATIDSSLESKLATQKEAVASIVRMSKTLMVVDEETAERATLIAGDAKRFYKKLEEMRKRIIQPSRDYIAKVNEAVGNFTDQLLDVERVVKEKVGAYQKALELKAIEEKDGSEVFVPQEASTVRAGKRTTMYQKEEITYEVIDFNAIPHEYLLVNHAKIKAALKGGISIPGIQAKVEVKPILRAV